MKTSTVPADEAGLARPKYYEMDGAFRANANRAWLLAFLTIPVALVAIGFAIFVRLQPPTVIRIGPNGDASCWARLRRALTRISLPEGRMSSWTRRW